jgi:putative transposase
MLDQLLSGADASTAFDQGGLLDQLKKALAERALNAEIDHHLASEGGAGSSRNGYGRKRGSPAPAGSRLRSRATARAASTRS